jgi:hypothetical protein
MVLANAIMVDPCGLHLPLPRPADRVRQALAVVVSARGHGFPLPGLARSELEALAIIELPGGGDLKLRVGALSVRCTDAIGHLSWHGNLVLGNSTHRHLFAHACTSSVLPLVDSIAGSAAGAPRVGEGSGRADGAIHAIAFGFVPARQTAVALPRL